MRLPQMRIEHHWPDRLRLWSWKAQPQRCAGHAFIRAQEPSARASSTIATASARAAAGPSPAGSSGAVAPRRQRGGRRTSRAARPRPSPPAVGRVVLARHSARSASRRATARSSSRLRRRPGEAARRQPALVGLRRRPSGRRRRRRGPRTSSGTPGRSRAARAPAGAPAGWRPGSKRSMPPRLARTSQLSTLVGRCRT